ncbi:hypothetical protein [Paenibacillus alvei]|uniref:hypothetical protein n=1 Tax=Paenibacillus alvei TaxID=44250 RepID=UPI00227DAEF9|nr:hypothetical protein [Paenibacillus alvei]
MKSYAINMDELKSKVEETIRVAANKFSRKQEGETHLVGLHDGQNIRELVLMNHYAKNVTYDGDTFVVLYRHEWFNPIEDWNLEKALEQELENDPEFKDLYMLALVTTYDSETQDLVLHDFIEMKKMLPNEADRLVKKWTEQALKDLIPVELEQSMNQIERSGLIDLPINVYRVNDSVIASPNKREALKFYFEDTVCHSYEDEEEIVINIRLMSDEELTNHGAPCCLSGGCPNCAEGHETKNINFKERMKMLGEGKRTYLLTRDFRDY